MHLNTMCLLPVFEVYDNGDKILQHISSHHSSSSFSQETLECCLDETWKGQDQDT